SPGMPTRASQVSTATDRACTALAIGINHITRPQFFVLSHIKTDHYHQTGPELAPLSSRPPGRPQARQITTSYGLVRHFVDWSKPGRMAASMKGFGCRPV